MKCLLSVSLATLGVLATYALNDYGQTPALQKGVSVQMAVTSNAAPMPAADDDDAWVVTVTADGKLYFGVKPVSADGLGEEMRIHPRRREQNLYIKADARAPFASVRKALEIGRASFFEAPVLLTSQPESAAPGTVVPPKGMEVLIGSPSTSESAVVQVLRSSDGTPTLTVNDERVSWDTLQSTLMASYQNRSEKLVVVKASGQVPFASVARVLDVCRAIGGRAVLAAPEI
jgi:biopolymer transport protein ExbD